MSHALYTLGKDELRDILHEQGAIDTQCHFCHTKYHYTAADIEIFIGRPKVRRRR